MIPRSSPLLLKTRSPREGAKVAEEPLEKLVVHAHVAPVVGVELEPELAVALASAADEHRLGKLERVRGKRVDLGAERRDLLRVDGDNDHARVRGEELDLGAGRPVVGRAVEMRTAIFSQSTPISRSEKAVSSTSTSA
jgi:hypothetical protein